MGKTLRGKGPTKLLRSLSKINDSSVSDIHGTGKQISISETAVSGLELTSYYKICNELPFMLIRLSISTKYLKPVDFI
jgi:hypothetical protein